MQSERKVMFCIESTVPKTETVPVRYRHTVPLNIIFFAYEIQESKTLTVDRGLQLFDKHFSGPSNGS